MPQKITIQRYAEESLWTLHIKQLYELSMKLDAFLSCLCCKKYKSFCCVHIQNNFNNRQEESSTTTTTQQHDQLRTLHGPLERIEWSEERRNAFTDEELNSVKSLNNITSSYLKTVCKSNRSTPDPVMIGFYRECKPYMLDLWVTTWLSQGWTAQGKQFTHMIALKYIAKVYHLKEAKKGTDE